MDFLVSEMVSADGLIRDSQKTINFISFLEEERPFGIQLFGSDVKVIAKAAEYLLRINPDFIDINMGCPVKKVIKRGAGSALMRDPEKASRIVCEVKNVLSGRIPLSVKFRSGWDSSSINFLEFGKMMENAGADTLCLHPRTTKQMFSGLSNWEHIASLKQVVSIPVIGNGDVISPETALLMKHDTNCDAIMIGRGALGKPWLFTQIKDYFGSGEFKPVSYDTIRDITLKHLNFALEVKQESVVIKEMRSQLCHYTKGLVGSAELRQKINHAKCANELRDILMNGIRSLGSPLALL